MSRPILALALCVGAMSALGTVTATAEQLRRGPVATFQPSPSGTLSPGSTAGLHRSYLCAVAGTPVEFPDDIQIWHPTQPTAAGTVVHWSVPAGGHQGSATLPALAAGQTHFLSNVLPGGVEAAQTCVILRRAS